LWSSMSGNLDKIDEFIRFLAENGGWCNLTGVAEAIQLSEDKVKEVSRLFAEAKFAEFDEERARVKLGPELRHLYMDLERGTKRAP